MRSLRYASAFLACILAVALLGHAGGQDKKMDGPEAAQDSAVKKGLVEVINRGVELYNSGDHMGCYRLYEGGLIAVRPNLTHRPGLQKEIEVGLLLAAQERDIPKKAYILRGVMDKIRFEIDPGSMKPPVATTLWQRLGGVENVTKVVDDLFATAGSDPKVNFWRTPDGKPTKAQIDSVPKLKKQVVAFISAVTGGPIKYEGKDMKEAHAGMKITDEEFNAFAGHLQKALVKNGAKPEDIKAVMDLAASTRKDIVEAKEPPTPPKEPAKTLWLRLGGEENVAKVVDDLFATAGSDPKVNFWRTPDGKPTQAQIDSVPKLKKQVIAFISSVTGGPIKYEGKDMKEAHAGMKITDEEFNAFAGHLQKALVKNGAKPEDIKAVMELAASTRKDIVEAK